MKQFGVCAKWRFDTGGGAKCRALFRLDKYYAVQLLGSYPRSSVLLYCAPQRSEDGRCLYQKCTEVYGYYLPVIALGNTVYFRRSRQHRALRVAVHERNRNQHVVSNQVVVEFFSYALRRDA